MFLLFSLFGFANHLHIYNFSSCKSPYPPFLPPTPAMNTLLTWFICEYLKFFFAISHECFYLPLQTLPFPYPKSLKSQLLFEPRVVSTNTRMIYRNLFWWQKASFTMLWKLWCGWGTTVRDSQMISPQNNPQNNRCGIWRRKRSYNDRIGGKEHSLNWIAILLLSVAEQFHKRWAGVDASLCEESPLIPL